MRPHNGIAPATLGQKLKGALRLPLEGIRMQSGNPDITKEQVMVVFCSTESTNPDTLDW